jgi:hypothetical protein
MEISIPRLMTMGNKSLSFSLPIQYSSPISHNLYPTQQWAQQFHHQTPSNGHIRTSVRWFTYVNIINCRECLVNVAACHWTRTAQLYHISCYLLSFSYPNAFLLIPGHWLAEPHYSPSYVFLIPVNSTIDYVQWPAWACWLTMNILGVHLSWPAATCRLLPVM